MGEKREHLTQSGSPTFKWSVFRKVQRQWRGKNRRARITRIKETDELSAQSMGEKSRHSFVKI